MQAVLRSARHERVHNHSQEGSDYSMNLSDYANKARAIIKMSTQESLK